MTNPTEPTIVKIDYAKHKYQRFNIPSQHLMVTGQKKREKVVTARTLWVPAVNNHGCLGRWSFLEIHDPWYAASAILGHLRGAGKGA